MSIDPLPAVNKAVVSSVPLEAQTPLQRTVSESQAIAFADSVQPTNDKATMDDFWEAFTLAQNMRIVTVGEEQRKEVEKAIEGTDS
jgi:hypothetical protein